MKKCILSITVDGYNLSQKIQSLASDFEIYTLEKFASTDDEIMVGGVKRFLKNNFQHYDLVVFIMATGIVVRLIKDLIQDKLTDPAVVVMDHKGNHVISLLSGHLGSANRETITLAKLLNATPVITTASDTNQTISVDLFARAHHCVIGDFNQAKKITAMIVNHKKVNIHSLWPMKEPSQENIFLNTKDENYDGTIVVTNRSVAKHQTKVRLFKKNLIVSIGCRQGKTSEKIIAFIKQKFSKLNLSLNALKAVVSVDIKQTEQGLIETAEYFNVPFQTIARERIKTIEDQFMGSDFVKEQIGVAAVSEPCGYIASNEGLKILKKQSRDGMTLSIWEEQDE